MPTPKLDFGYCPPSGERGAETIRRDQFVADLHSVLDVAAQAFGSIWISDHLMFGAKYRLEGWTQLAWLAARYPNVNLGHMVLANSFRNPALLAKMAATLQALSGGRFILAYGAGWHEEEYKGYGFEFPAPARRIAMLEEGLRVIRLLWTEPGPVNFKGRFYTLENAHCEPRPQPAPPIMVGGAGEKLTLRVVARHADWWNDTLRPAEALRHKLAVLREHCQAEGRDFASLRKTVNAWVFLNRSHAVAQQRAAQRTADNEVIAGDPAAVRDRLTELAEMGFETAMLVFPNFPETDDLRLFEAEVRPHFA